MAELTPNIKLRVDDDLDTDARYNLYRIDSSLGSGLFDSSGILTLRSSTDISLRPGNGNGGSLICNHKLTNFSINSTTLTLNDDITFSGTWTMPWANVSKSGASLSDFSDTQSVISANTDVSANTSHRSDTGNPHSTTAAQVGAYSTAQTDTLLAGKADTTHTHTAADVTDFDTEVSNNTDVAANTSHRNNGSLHFSEASINHDNITNAGSNTHAQLDAHLASSSNPHSVTAAQIDAYTTAQTNAQIASHNALSAAHGVIGAIVGTSDAQTLTNKIINAPDNTITNISNSNINANAAIEGTKIDPDFGNQVLNTTDGMTFEEGGIKVKLRAAQSGMTADFNLDLPVADGTAGQLLATNGSGQLQFVTSAATSLLPENNVRVGDNADAQQNVDTSLLGDVLADTTTGLTLKAGTVANAEVAAGAAIALNKLAAVTPDKVLVSDGSGFVTPAGTSSAEVSYLIGVTSSIQTQLDAKQATITGAATTVTSADLTINRALISNGSGKIAISSVTDTELGYVSGVTSAIQTQIDGKEPTITGAATTITSSDLVINRALVSNSSGKVVISAVTSTELSYVSGVSSAIQTQINGKQATITGAATTITSADLTINRALISDGSGKVAISAVTNTELGHVSGVTSAIQTQIDGKEADLGTPAGDGYVLVSTTGDVRSWAAPSAIGFQDPTTTEGDLIYNNGTITTRLPIGGANTVLKSNGTTVSYGSIVDANVDASAAISLSKLSALTADRALVSNGSGVITAAAVTATELGYLDGVTSNIQTQIDGLPAGSVFKTDWTNAQGASKVVTHSLGTRDVMVELYDTVTYETVLVDTVVRTDTNTVTLTAAAAPTNTIRVLIKEI